MKIEQLDLSDHAGKNHRYRAESDAAQKCHEHNQDSGRIADQSEETYHDQHDDCADDGFGRAPDDFTGYDFFNVERCRHHRVEGFLIIHPYKRTERVFKKRIVHNVNRQQSRRDKKDVRNVLACVTYRTDEAAETDAEGQKVKKRFQQRRKEVDLPAFPVNGEVALPHTNKSG